MGVAVVWRRNTCRATSGGIGRWCGTKRAGRCWKPHYRSRSVKKVADRIQNLRRSVRVLQTRPMTTSTTTTPTAIPITDEERRQMMQIVLTELNALKPLPDHAPPRLWHYTGGEGMMGIVQSGSIWTTQVACLNDSKEIDYAADLFLGAMHANLSDPNLSSTSRNFVEGIIQTTPRRTALESEFYVACLTEVGDDLSQWRGYAGGEGGFAIGFDVKMMISSVTGMGYLSKVSYDPKYNSNLARRIAAATIAIFENGIAARPGVNPEDWANAFMPDWRWLITHLGASVKHPSFCAEREWRYIRSLVPSDISTMKYRSRGGMITSHIPRGFLPSSGSGPQVLSLSDILIGPSRHADASEISVHRLLATAQHYAPGSVVVHKSTIPFQG